MTAGMAALVDELVRVFVEPSLWGQGGLVEVVALVAALAGLDEHHGPAKAFPIGAGEGHAGRARAAGRAAAAVSADAAVVGPVQAGAPAASVGEPVRLRGFVGARALPSFLWTKKEKFSDRHLSDLSYFPMGGAVV